MENIKAAFVVLAALIGGCSTAEIKQGPNNATSLHGKEARFNCTVTTDYEILIWLLHDDPVLSIVRNEPIITDDRFKSQNYTSDLGYTAEMIIFNLSLGDRGKVTCSLQSAGSKTAFLDVQVNGTLLITNTSLAVMENTPAVVVCKASGWLPAPDMRWLVNSSYADPQDSVIQITKREDGLYDTVNTLNITTNFMVTLTCMATITALPSPRSVTANLTITSGPVDRRYITIVAVTGSITAVLVIILLIGAIIFCIQRYKSPQSTYQDEIRKVSSKKKDVNKYTGQDNNGFSNDENNDCYSGRSSSGIESTSRYYYRNKELDGADISQVPDAIQKMETFYQGDRETINNLKLIHYPTHPRNIRHVTAV